MSAARWTRHSRRRSLARFLRGAASPRNAERAADIALACAIGVALALALVEWWSR